MYGCSLASGVEVPCIFYSYYFKLLFEKKGGGIFGDQKFILDRQLALELKS